MQRFAGRIILLWGWRRALLAFLAGALAVLAQAPYDFFAVCFVSFPVLVWLLDGATGEASDGWLRRLRPAFATGWWFGFGYFLAGLWWIGQALLVEADSFAWALPFAVVGIPFALAFFYGFATVVARLFWTSDIGRIAALAFGFGLAEWLRDVLFTGFPWNAVGYAAMPVPLLMQSVSVTGMIGMNTLAVFVFSLPALVAARRHLKLGAALLAILVAGHVGFGYVRLAAPPKPQTRAVVVRIVQPAVDLGEKWDASVRDRIFATLLGISAKAPEQGHARPQLILWPETSVPFLFTERPDALKAIGDMLGDGQMLIAGVVREEGGSGNAGSRYYNSVVAINDKGEIADAVDKVHLVPFGEYLPFADLFSRFGVGQLVAGPMNFAAGNERHAIMLPNGLRAVPFICYEVIFPDLVSDDAASADLIVNVTNDAWFGDTPGPYQHFRQAQVRAVENGLPLLRAGNNGISAVVDPRGRIVDALAVDARGAIDAHVPVSNQAFLSARQRRINGLLIMLLFALTAVAFSVRQRLRVN
ncbi:MULTISPECIES: apolipoprotein N-acyltransferase [unclassified Mesorhizobium]|uniref:apolipoprotein N-acyltransferase n=1 Tax=unclassified Mesorhizobium TaxID=325217 RepID=UPI000BAE8736|nr:MULTISPECIES: apolipoprotein N-acyltransferase [unclassified Mesorhizobium]TGT54196.1 apolipoprotein N-acyltransferase [Mesorhizobium sp. M00.F.Ca.ET.170.01.1.1]AZO09905.1 apolipoprotein N-acyltransferase [Mesorhizobium sp. M3A.F.Ca.ET.080.04.2.1]PBB86379.1 apolipoprotein N-acyltransferase [Mesorhizobium sp. WSM3876]RWE24484.1 MAG: apolipoprotein N-acyltransferase [Mesorhizobium sp.]RWE33062.1 MAG: apolipoprotein N-acyltransferase [Mesorhizobium sp.]